jgi:hypothetical protein
MRHLEIYHPYGTVGRLPWEKRAGLEPVDFGAQPSTDQLLKLAGGIRTFTEGTADDRGENMFARTNMLTANMVLFLGFAFHDLNMDLLTPTDEDYGGVPNPAPTRYLGTAKGISAGNCELITERIVQLRKSGRPVVKLSRELECAGFMDEYSRAVTLAAN